MAQSRGQGFTRNTGDRTNSTRQMCNGPIGGGEPNYFFLSFFILNVPLLGLTKLSGVIVASNLNVNDINNSLFV